MVGGAAVTEEFHPGFRNSTASYTVSLLNPKVIGDLNLAAHGLRVIERPFSNFLPLNDHDYIKVKLGDQLSEGALVAIIETTEAPALAATAATPTPHPQRPAMSTKWPTPSRSEAWPSTVAVRQCQQMG